MLKRTIRSTLFVNNPKRGCCCLESEYSSNTTTSKGVVGLLQMFHSLSNNFTTPIIRYYSSINTSTNHNKTNGKPSIGIIGGGPGGLSSALILASKGFPVTVFEKGSKIGGRNAPLQVGESTLDTGPTLLIMKFILEAVFRDAGRNVDDYLKFIRLDPMYRLVFHDGTHIDCHDLDHRQALESEIDRVFGKDAVKGFHEWLKFEEKRYPYTMKLLEKIYSSHLDIINWDAIKALPYVGLHKSMATMLRRYFKNPMNQIILSYQAKYLGMSPWQAPSVYGLIPYAEYQFGIYHVEGGLSKISEQMANILTNEFGAKIHLDSTVEKLNIEKGSRLINSIEVRHGNSQQTTRYEFDEIICNADIPYVIRNNIPNADQIFSTWKPSTFDKKKFSCSGFNMYLSLDKLYDNVTTHVISFPKDIKKSYKLMEDGDWNSDICVYVRNSCTVDKTVSKEGKSGLFVMVFVPNLQVGKIDWTDQQTIEKTKQLAFDILEQKCGFTNLRNHIEDCKLSTPLTWKSEKNIEFGAVFAMSNTLFQSLSFRPRNKFHELDNLYLSGGHTHPGSGLPTIMESARIVTSLLCEKYKVPYTLKMPSFYPTQ